MSLKSHMRYDAYLVSRGRPWRTSHELPVTEKATVGEGEGFLVGGE